MPDIFNSTKPSKKEVKKGTLDQKIDEIKKENKAHASFPGGEGETINLPEGYDIKKHPDHSESPLASYCFYPSRVSYVNLDSQEKTILILRKHPITNLSWMILVFFFILTPAFFPVFPFFDFLPGSYKIILTLVWYLVVTAFAVERFLSWFFNVNLITDERIMDIDFPNLMYREITEANLDEIQEVTFKPATGIMSFFDYGDVTVQTAAELPEIDFEDVPKPQKVMKILRELRIQEEIEKIEGRVR